MKPDPDALSRARVSFALSQPDSANLSIQCACGIRRVFTAVADAMREETATRDWFEHRLMGWPRKDVALVFLGRHIRRTNHRRNEARSYQ